MATLSQSGAPVGRPPSDDDATVREIVAKVGRGVRLSVALVKFSASDKRRLRRKVQRFSDEMISQVGKSLDNEL
jgi:hypothetical protein